MHVSFLSITSLALLSAFTDGILHQQRPDVAVHNIRDSIVDSNYGTYTSASPSSSYSSTTETEPPSYQNHTYIFTYPEPLSYTSKITITQCGATTSTSTSYTTYTSPTGIDYGPSNPLPPPSPLATVYSSGVPCTTAQGYSIYFKGNLYASCKDRSESCCKNFGMNYPGGMVWELKKMVDDRYYIIPTRTKLHAFKLGSLCSAIIIKHIWPTIHSPMMFSFEIPYRRHWDLVFLERRTKFVYTNFPLMKATSLLIRLTSTSITVLLS